MKHWKESHTTHSVDEISVKLHGMTVFTIVAFKKGYWMVVLHPDSRKLTCNVLPFGRFQCTRLSMGTVVAQDIFQSKLDAIFDGMKGVTRIADDMIIYGAGENEHDENFLNFIQKCMLNNLNLNVERIQFKQAQVSLFGHCWSKHRISQDPTETEALNHMRFPADKETMRSFQGMVNYLNKYSTMCAHFLAPANALTHQTKDYKSTQEHFKLSEDIKKEVSTIGALPFFDINAKTTQTDAPDRCMFHLEWSSGELCLMCTNQN